jgi:HTH-type transcriptional regulator, transcriptional repressor of NAD biosynthesis genes
MTKAFVFGKFLPFHAGHEALIRFALTQCDLLTILVCCSNKESIAAGTRLSWIENCFKNEKKAVVQVFEYSETVLPNTSQSDEAVSEQWAAVFKQLLPHHNLLVTSEPYGNYVAAFMNIQHIPFDMDRKTIPVSASAIRCDLINNWQFLPESVKPFYAVKVVILGTESTGKSTLTQQLTQHFNCTGVAEAGRDLIENSNSFEMDDLKKVAAAHAQRINEAVTGNHPLIIIDTDIHITLSYAEFIFNEVLHTDEGIYNSNKADLYLYLTSEVPYFQDGTRLHETERNLLDASHRKVLAAHQIPFTEISGNWEQRFQKSVQLIEALVKNRLQNQPGTF